MPEEDGQVPWNEGEFDEEKAKSLILSLRSENKTLKDRLKDSTAKSKSNGSAKDELQKENVNLKVQLATGLNDRQVARLVGDTLEEKMQDAEAYAEETGIELRSFLEPEAEGTPEDRVGAEGEEEERKPAPGMNYRAPAQKVETPPEVDIDALSKELLRNH